MSIRYCSEPGCQIEISLANQSGYCSYHYVDHKREAERAQRAKCKHPHCYETVSKGSSSGYCRTHAQTEKGANR